MKTTRIDNSIADTRPVAVHDEQWMRPFVVCALCAVGIGTLHKGGGS